MRCKHCGTEFDTDICKSCGRVRGRPAHWVPLITTAVAFFVFFGLLGGDLFYYEVNIFDYIAAAVSAAAIILAFGMIPKQQATLRAASIILAFLSAFSAVGWIILH